MKIAVTVTDEDVKKLIAAKLNDTLGDSAPSILPSDIQFLVKSKNNYKPQDWEPGTLAITVTREI